ncbi:LLM class flavin-dependent oxidoreductase [Lentzea sp. NPDC055074]
MGPRSSVLDTSPIVRGSTPREALSTTVDLAELADELGFHRYWVPEHHGMRGVASAAPAVLVAHLAAVTSRLRVGPAAVARGLQAVLDETGTPELMITSPIHHHADRRRSYEPVVSLAPDLTVTPPRPS